MTYEEYVKSLGVELGEPFQISFDGEGGRKSNRQYQFTIRGLENYGSGTGQMDRVTLDSVFKDLIIGKFTIIKPFPQKGDVVYYPDITSREGIYRTQWFDLAMDRRVKSRVGVYPDYESAKQKAIELGWIEGDE